MADLYSTFLRARMKILDGIGPLGRHCDWNPEMIGSIWSWGVKLLMRRSGLITWDNTTTSPLFFLYEFLKWFFCLFLLKFTFYHLIPSFWIALACLFVCFYNKRVNSFSFFGKTFVKLSFVTHNSRITSYEYVVGGVYTPHSSTLSPLPFGSAELLFRVFACRFQTHFSYVLLWCAGWRVTDWGVREARERRLRTLLSILVFLVRNSRLRNFGYTTFLLDMLL